MPRIYRFKIHFVDLVLNGIIMKWKKKAEKWKQKDREKEKEIEPASQSAKKSLNWENLRIYQPTSRRRSAYFVGFYICSCTKSRLAVCLVDLLALPSIFFNSFFCRFDFFFISSGVHLWLNIIENKISIAY